MIEQYKQLIEKTLSELISTCSTFFPSLYEGGRWALLAPAKRIRPLLTLLTAEMLKPEAYLIALPPACALEMVHTYSLIHDDLPCMDDDDFRRGRPTLHRVYGEGHAVLVGDFLLTFAFEVIANSSHLSAEQKIALTRTLAREAGAEGMIGGQVMDIETSAEIAEIHRRKTGALFCASVEFGGIIAEAPSELQTQLRNFGSQFGQLFQMVDDILDGDHPLGHERAEEKVGILFQNVLNILDTMPGNTTFLKELIHDVFTQCEKSPTPQL